MSLQLLLRIEQENAARDARLDALRAGEPAVVAAESGSDMAARAANLRLLLDAVYTETRSMDVGAKASHKRERAGFELRHFAQGFLSAPEPLASTAVCECAVWLADIDEWPLALALADSAIALKLPMPERFNNPLDWLLADQLLKQLQAQFKATGRCDYRLQELTSRVEAGAWSAHHSVLHGLLKLRGFAAEEAGEHAEALRLYEQLQAATGTDAGVKGRVSKLRELVSAAKQEPDHD